MDIVAVDTIITDARYIMTGHGIIFIPLMLIPMITDLNIERKDIAVHRILTMLRKMNEPVLQENTRNKLPVRLNPQKRTVPDRKPFGYGKAMTREVGNPQSKGKRAQKDAGHRKQQFQSGLNGIITEMPKTTTLP
jgi:hypothetical protein